MNKTKLKLDENFNVVDTDAESKLQERKKELRSSIDDMKMRRSYLQEDIADLDTRISAEEAELANLSVEDFE